MISNLEIESSEEFGEAMAEVRTSLNSYSLRDKQRQQVGEMVRFMNRYAESSQISARDEQYVRSWIKQGRHVLERASQITDSLCFRNFLNNMQENQHQGFNRAMGIAVSLEAVSHPGNGLSDSFWEETIQSLNKFVSQADRIFDSFAEDYGVQTWFVLFNLIEALNVGDQSELLDQYQELVSKYDSTLTTCIDKSPGLQVYAYDLRDQGLISVGIQKITPSQRSGFPNRTLVYDVLGRLRRGEPTSISELIDSTPSKKPHLWAVARAWIRTNHHKPSGVLPYSHGVDLDYLFNKMVLPTGDDLAQVTLDEDDLQKVRQMDDEEIQSALVRLFASNRFLTETSRVSLDQEKEKSHAGGEISDFDIEIKIEADETPYYVSFPIKSGVEAGNRNVEQLAESNLHQLVRPVIRLKKCAVFPILIAGTSLNLQEVLKSHRSMFNLPIKFIDEELFTRILKINSLL
jgi:hypothetical protein